MVEQQAMDAVHPVMVARIISDSEVMAKKDSGQQGPEVGKNEGRWRDGRFACTSLFAPVES